MHKKLFALLLALSMVLSLAMGVSAAGAASGSCGEDARWSFADGTLTISGTGPMMDYREYDWEQDKDYFFDKPWDGFSQEIRRIVIGEGITRLGSDAFTNLSNLQSVKLPSTLTEIGNFVFWGCSSLESIELPEGLTSLGQHCFFGTGLKAVEIPASVTFVDACVFDSCKALTDVYFRSDPNIPSFTTGNSIFENCTALKEIRVEEGHLALRSIDGALYFMWDSGEMALNSYPAGRENTELRIADKTVLVEQSSVWGNPHLRNVIIPDTVTKIGNNAFMGCDNMETVKFEGSAPEIQANAFWGANVTIYYPAGDESWDAREQWTADYLVGWQGSLVWESYVPEVRTGTCGDNAVWQFKNGKLTISGTGAIYDYEPGVENTTTAPWSAFAEEITEVVIDDGITKIGQMDFRGLSELKNVTIPDSVTFIGNWAFWDCKSLEAVDLPDYLTGIGQEAFEWCSSLKTIEIPATVTFLDGGAFDFCTGLTDVYFRSDPNLPSFMTAHSLFRACRSLEQIRVEEGHIAMKSIDGVLYLYDEASGALTLTNYPLGRKDAQFRVPDGTTTVGQFSMMGAPSLETVVFPDSLTKIAYSALSGCYDLKSVRFEGSAPELEESVFLGCNLTAFYPMDDPTWAAIEGWTDRYLVGGPMVGGHQGSIEWVPYVASAEGICGDNATWHLKNGELTISGTGEMYDNWTIDNEQWAGLRDQITHLVVEDGITYIGAYSFGWCRNLSSVTLSDTVTDIGSAAFFYCEDLGSIELPETLTSIGNNAFAHSGLKTIEIPENVTFLGANAFANCENLADVLILGNSELPGMTTGNSVFESCSSLARIRVEEDHPFLRSMEGVLYIEDYDGSLRLNSYPAGREEAAFELAENTVSIEQYAFRGAERLQEVTIPATVTHVGSGAFQDNVNLKLVSFQGSAPEFGQMDVFSGCALTIRYPSGDSSWDDRESWNLGGSITWEAQSTVNPFGDVPAGAFYEKPVLWAVEKGITSGTSAGTFSPGNDCLRAQVVTFLWRAAGEPEPSSTVNPFEDVTEGDFYYKAVLWAVENGITNGSDATHFNPMGVCNRAQVVTFLHRAFGNPAVENAANPFTDVTGDTWYAAPVLWAVENSITNGLTATEFGPNSNCNRAQIVTFLYRAYT